MIRLIFTQVFILPFFVQLIPFLIFFSFFFFLFLFITSPIFNLLDLLIISLVVSNFTTHLIFNFFFLCNLDLLLCPQLAIVLLHFSKFFFFEHSPFFFVSFFPIFVIFLVQHLYQYFIIIITYI